MEGDKVLDRKTDLPPNFYSTVSFTDKLLGMLDGRTDEEKRKSFFGYLAYTAPHWPLQAPPEKIQKYGESPGNDDSNQLGSNKSHAKPESTMMDQTSLRSVV